MRNLLILCTLSIFALPAGLRAELECPRPVVDLGDVRSGVVLRPVFVLRNTGTHTLEIREVKPGCGCLKARLESHRLAPGEQIQLHAEIHTVTQAEGPNRWRVEVRWQRGDRHEELHLEAKAQVQTEVTIRPARLVVHTSSGHSHPFTLSERADRPREIVGIESSLPHVRCEPSRARREGDGWQRTLTLEILPTLPDGRHEGVLCVHTKDPACPEWKVPFTVVKHGSHRLQASPAQVEVPGPAFPARIVLVSATDSPVRIERVEPDADWMRCSFCEGPGERSTLRVVIQRDRLPAGTVQGLLRVYRANSAEAPLEIPVRVVR